MEPLILFSKNLEEIISFVHSENQTFINYGTAIQISPMARITSIEINPEKNNATFYFGAGQDLKTNSSIEFPFTEGNKDIFTAMALLTLKGFQEREEKKYILPPKTSSPEIVMINFKEFLKDFTSKTEVAFIEIPNDTLVERAYKFGPPTKLSKIFNLAEAYTTLDKGLFPKPIRLVSYNAVRITKNKTFDIEKIIKKSAASLQIIDYGIK